MMLTDQELLVKIDEVEGQLNLAILAGCSSDSLIVKNLKFVLNGWRYLYLKRAENEAQRVMRMQVGRGE